MAPTRRLTAILAADVAGYSRLMGADEEGTHERLRAHLAELVHPKIEEHRGRVVKNTGGGLLAEFASVVDAVRCAVEIQRGGKAPDGFEERAREKFLERYLAEVDSALLPAGEAAIANLLSIFELEKGIYELQYELDNRPDWVAIPVAGIRRLLEDDQ